MNMLDIVFNVLQFVPIALCKIMGSAATVESAIILMNLNVQLRSQSLCEKFASETQSSTLACIEETKSEYA